MGGGPTGLTAAIYAARENYSVLIVERSGLGGQAAITERLDNYPGFPEGVGGAELADRMAAQAARYGVEALQAVGVKELLPGEAGEVEVVTSTGERYRAGAVLVATGSTYRRLHAEGEDNLIGAGVHFCATCDGPFYRDAEEVVVIGGGNSGLEEGLFLTQFARHVTVVEYADQLAGNRLLQDKVRAHPRMTVHTGTQVTRFEADAAGKLAAVWTRPAGTDEAPARRPATGAFVFIGLTPNTAFLGERIAVDAAGFVVTDRTFATSLPGVFAAGDVRQGSTKQLAAAVGEGAAAAIQIRHHLDAAG
ncbi:MAG: NAD(P)/FAD-dependent oxidoreductase [Acidimicrobiia bacterium]